VNTLREQTKSGERIADAFYTLTCEPSSIGSGKPSLRLSTAGGRVRDEATQDRIHNVSLSSVVVLESDPAMLEIDSFEGKSLQDYMAVGGIDQRAALSILRQLARALDALHAQGLTHGTLRGNSVLVDEAHRIRLFDWALAFDALSETQALELIDSLSPECLFGDAVSPQSDQFALGILAHRLLTGKHAFDGATKIESILGRLLGVWSRADRPPLEGHEAFDRVFAPDPSHRFASCEQFVLALERELASAAQLSVMVARSMTTAAASVTAAPVVPIEQPKPAWRRHALLAAMVLAIAAFVFGLMSWLTQRSLAETQAKMLAVKAEQAAAVGENGRMKVCNPSSLPIQIRQLAIAYWDKNNQLRSFANGADQARGWTVAPNSEQRLSWTPADANSSRTNQKIDAWDGSVLFYFLDIEQGDRQYLLSGAWSNALHGCLALVPDTTH
jgi:serine/threonine protein kinase